MMRRLLVAIFAFVLIASPFMAHHAVGEVAHDHGNISSHADYAASSQCEYACESGSKTSCCSQAITHCSPTSSYNEVWTENSPNFNSEVYFSIDQDLFAQLMFEAETPPPRV